MGTRVHRQRTATHVPPTGTVTFLFSDIVGSTQRWERDSEAMARALARHDAIVRDAIERHGGHVFKTIGDAFCAAFAGPYECVAAAIDIQRAMTSEDFSRVEGLFVRTAIHTGTADERGGDYFGPAVNRVARMLSSAHGSQILVSAATAGMLRERSTSEFDLRDLGMHRLKDLARAEPIFQLCADGLPDVFPALRSSEDFPNNLPRRLTSFVGRTDVMDELKSLISDSPLVTIVGSGGVGKTSCALAAGYDLLQSFADGAWMAELAPLSDATLVSPAIAKALNLRESPPLSLPETLSAYLKRKNLLLILDNCEHVLEGVRAFVPMVLRDCPGVKILATSRERLGVHGESVYRMPSLAVSGAMQLFTDRAVAVDRRFELSDMNTGDVEAICRELDGIPLALELAAARIKVLSAKQLRERLGERFRVLTGGDRAALPRHQTMRALIDWSYGLLSEMERALFRRTSIFSGGFTLECAHAVFAQPDGDELETLDLLSSLVEKSLVQVEPWIAEEKRYGLLESTRRYGREKLVEHGELDAAARSHAQAFLALSERLERDFEDLPDAVWKERVIAELPNWRAALKWALDEGRDVPAGQRLAGALCDVWRTFEPSEGSRWISLARQFVTSQTTPEVLAKLDFTEAVLKGSLSDYKGSYATAKRAIDAYEGLGDELAVAWSRLTAASALVFTGRVEEGAAMLEDVLVSARRLGIRSLLRAVLSELGNTSAVAGNVGGARAYFAEALELYRQSGSVRGAMAVTSALAEAEFAGGDAEAALNLVAGVLDQNASNAELHSAGVASCNAAAYAIALDRFADSMPYASRALDILRDLHGEIGLLCTFQHIAAALALSEEQAADASTAKRKWAALILGYVDARLAACESTREYTEHQEYERLTSVLAGALGEPVLSELLVAGAAWSEDRAIAEVSALT